MKVINKIAYTLAGAVALAVLYIAAVICFVVYAPKLGWDVCRAIMKRTSQPKAV